MLVHSISVATLPNTLMFTGCEFSNNYYNGQGAIEVQNSDISIIDTRFSNNRAISSLHMSNSVVNIDKSVFKHNYASAITFSECTVNIFDSVYDSNQGEGNKFGGAITSHDSVVHIHNSDFKKNGAKLAGGAMYCEGSSIFLYEICTLSDNHAEQGGAVYLHQDVQYHIAHGATVIIANNTASDDGGGMYLGPQCSLTVHSQSALHILENFANSGGGIYVFQSSSINAPSKLVNSVIYFHKNEASDGGGLYLEFNSTVYTVMCHNNSIRFLENSAMFGGAVYVSTKQDPVDPVPECFFQSLSNSTPAYNIITDTGPGRCSKENDPAFKFPLNRAIYFGASLYKNFFDKCSINGKLFEEFMVISSLSNIRTSDIDFFHVQICFCENSTPDCTKLIA